MFDKQKWNILKQDEDIVNNLKNELNISNVCARLLYNRGITDYNEAYNFINKTQLNFYDPFYLNDMDVAIERLLKAIKNKETVTIYGDYDADGITATSILYNHFKDLIEHLYYHIPLRNSEGYGLNKDAFDAIKENGTTLVITVDTGSKGNLEVEYAKSIGIDVIITDHHDCPSTLPNAVAVINPCRNDSKYPFKYLAGVGVAFKFICAYETYNIVEEENKLEIIKALCIKYIDLVMIGTVADIMPLKSENRLFVYLGKKLIFKSNNIGLKALLEVTNISKFDDNTIGYILAPRINACGRMDDPTIPVKLFISTNYEDAFSLAKKMNDINQERQNYELVVVHEAISIIEKNMLYTNPLIIVDSNNWSQGIAGLVAGKIVERYNKPAIVISFMNDENIGKGSCRTIKSINIIELLKSCSNYLISFGGHAGAAGLTISKSQYEEFKNLIYKTLKNKYMNELISNKQFDVDCTFTAKDLNIDNYKSFNVLEPFGNDNQNPIFFTKNAVIKEIRTIKEGKHTKLKLIIDDISIDAIMFNYNLNNLGFNIGDRIDIIYNLDINNFNGYYLQLILVDIDNSDEYSNYLSILQDKLDLILSNNYEIDYNIYPNRNDCIYVYRKLQEILKNTEQLVSIKSVIDVFTEENYLRTGIILIAFKQTGIINMEHKTKDKYLLSLNKVSNIDVFSAPILKQ